MPTIVWLEIPRPMEVQQTAGWGDSEWGNDPWGAPSTAVTGMGWIDWVEITEETEGE